jgi:hypothetical protein
MIQIATEPPRCGHHQRELRRRRIGNGAVIVGLQCLGCGRSVERIAKKGIDTERLPWWDTDLEARWRARQEAYWQSRQRSFEEQREEERRQFWRRYHEHLASPKWQALRRRVFERSRGMCEGCSVNRAVQVHHLTYERLGDEMLFDLVAVCMTCHEKIHQPSRNSEM